MKIRRTKDIGRCSYLTSCWAFRLCGVHSVCFVEKKKTERHGFVQPNRAKCQQIHVFFSNFKTTERKKERIRSRIIRIGHFKPCIVQTFSRCNPKKKNTSLSPLNFKGPSQFFVSNCAGGSVDLQCCARTIPS